MRKKIFIYGFVLIFGIIVALGIIWYQKQHSPAIPASLVQKEILETINLQKLEPDMRLIWVTDEKGKEIKPVLIRIGITDGQYTEIKEILFGEIKEGDFIVTGKTTPQSSSASQQDINRIFRSLR